ncbi:ATP-dependent RecD-like DNA helicase [termite gut metagenome]|uniref:ATP-dependent RecD-like DNA helicase n=1 Tax=termite gut metagenome TaxID=433724 RepID=A0A5J4S8X0_9ZZZZ
MVTKKKITLTPGQKDVFENLVDFIRDKSARIFILKGYAGTGKTTMMKVLIEELKKRNLSYSLLASTGRAAKILCNITGQSAKTIHSEIYTYQDLNQDLEEVVRVRMTGIDLGGQLLLTFSLNVVEREKGSTRYYIVDEASMISDKEDKNATQAFFGSGRLLKDLLDYDGTGKFIFIGDACQLPPVTQRISPALSVEYLEQVFNIRAQEAELTEIVRQKDDNGIVLSSKNIRNLYANPQPWKWAKFPFRNYSNIHIIPNQDTFIQSYIDRVKTKGFNDSTLICFSNKQCDTITNIIRLALGIRSPQLFPGDLLMITQNNYFSGLMNGDLAVVESVGIEKKKAGLTFIKVSIKELFTKNTYSLLLIADILYSNQTNLTQTQQKELLIDFYQRMKRIGIGQKHQLFNTQMMKDPYLNALRAVYGYALTCHKAQGGEWNHVYLDIARNVPALEKPYVYQWIYTAMTRAKVKLYLVEDFWIS